MAVPVNATPRHLQWTEVGLLILPALLLMALALHFGNQEIARHDVKRVIVGRWRRTDGYIIVCRVQRHELLINDNSYQYPDKQISFKFIDDNHFQMLLSSDPQLHLITEVTINSDTMRWRTNEHPPTILILTRIKAANNKSR